MQVKLLMFMKLYIVSNNVAIPREFLGTEQTNFALDLVMFFIKYLSCYLTNFEET